MVTETAIIDVLRTINDPEMPISIVDLGVVNAVHIEQGQASVRVVVEILPTFVGCPALPVIGEEVRQRVSRLEGVGAVDVRFRFDPPWTVDRISAAGREALRQTGVTVPSPTQPGQAEPSCPFCGSSTVHLESSFGPTRCRIIYYCESCRNPFEHMKKIRAPE
jgi:ring-1,2-phenylacetyl-CoA epoxidase subunit PaaD